MVITSTNMLANRTIIPADGCDPDRQQRFPINQLPIVCEKSAEKYTDTDAVGSLFQLGGARLSDRSGLPKHLSLERSRLHALLFSLSLLLFFSRKARSPSPESSRRTHCS